MRRLGVVGALVGMLALVAASQHSPPAQDHVLTLKAPVTAEVASLAPVASFDGYVIKVTVGQHILVPAQSLRSLEATPKLRPSWQAPKHVDNYAHTWRHNATTRHVSNTSMRGWGFL